MPPTIMLAVNDPNILYLLQRYAEESGFSTVCADPREDIPALAQQSRPALIILELSPYSTGQDALLALKAAPMTKHIPVVVYSGLEESFGDRPESVVGVFKPGMFTDFLTVLKSAGVLPQRIP